MLCSIIGTIARPAPSCNSVKLRSACDTQQFEESRQPGREQQHDDDRRRESQLHECLQVVIVRIVDEPADVRDLEAREDFRVGGQSAAERQELDGSAQCRRVNGPSKIGARLQLTRLEPPQQRTDAERERDADRNA